MNCSTCHFGWIRKFGHNVTIQPHWPTHECRHNAPVAGVDSDGNEISPWPLVNGLDACGKWAIPGSEPSNTDPARGRTNHDAQDAGRVEVPEFDPNTLDIAGTWDSSDFRVFIAGAKEGHRALASRLSPSPQPSADVVELEILRKIAALWLPPFGVPPTDESRALFARLDAIRSSTNHDSKET